MISEILEFLEIFLRRQKKKMTDDFQEVYSQQPTKETEFILESNDPKQEESTENQESLYDIEVEGEAELGVKFIDDVDGELVRF